MKIVTSAFIAAAVTSFLVVLNAGCSSDTTSDEPIEGSEAELASGNCKYLPDGTVRCQDPAPDGGHTIMKVTPAPTNTIMKVTPAPTNTIMKVPPPSPDPSTGTAKLHCAGGAEDTPNGCFPGYSCCASGAYGQPPICIKGSVCPKLP